ncbi:MAG: S-layer homology domain-containing protein, partial [Fervidobacterium sp.]
MRKALVIVCVVLILIFISNSSYADTYKDVPQSHWAYEAVEFLTKIGIVSGFPDGTYRGNEATTRFQVALLMYRLYYSFDIKVNELKSKIESLEAKMAGQLSSKSPSQTSSTTLDPQIKELSSEINSLKVYIESLSKDVKKLTNDVNNLSSITNKIAGDVNEGKKNYDSLKSLVESLNSKYSSLMNKVKEIENNYQQSSLIFTNIEAKVKSVEEALNKNVLLLKNEIQSLVSADEELKKKMKLLEDKYQEILNSKQTNNLTGFPTNIAEEKAIALSYNEEIKSINAKIDSLTDQLRYVKTLQEQLNEIKSEVNKLKGEIDNLKKISLSPYEDSSLAEMEKKISSAFSILDNLRIELKNLYNATTITNEHADKIKKIESDLERIQTLSSILIDKDSDLEIKIEELKVKLDKLLSESRKNEPEKSYDDKSKNQTVILDIEKLVEQVREKIYSSAEFLMVLESVEQISQLEKEIESMNSKLRNLEMMVANINETSTKNDIQQIRKEFEALKEVLSQLKFAQIDESYISELIKNVEDKNKQISELSQYTQNLSKKIESINEKLNNLINETSKISQSTSLTLLEADIMDLKSKVKKLEEEVQKRVTTSQLNSTNQNVQKILSMLLDLEKMVKEAGNSQTGNSIKYEKVINDLQNKQSELLRDLENIKVSMKSLKDKFDNLESKLSTIEKEDLKTRLEEINAKIEDINNKDYALNEKLMKNIDNLKSEVKFIAERLDSLAKTYQTSEETLSSLPLDKEIRNKLNQLEIRNSEL